MHSMSMGHGRGWINMWRPSVGLRKYPALTACFWKITPRTFGCPTICRMHKAPGQPTGFLHDVDPEQFGTGLQ